MPTVLEFVFSDLSLATRVLRQLPCMRDVVALALTSRFFYERFKTLLPAASSTEDTMQQRIFSHILAQTLYKSYSNLPLLSTQDHLSRETDRASLVRNYLVSISPRIGLDLDCLLPRFWSEHGSAFRTFLSYRREHFLAIMPFVHPNSSLIQLRAEFCKTPDNIRLLTLGGQPLDVLRRLRLNQQKQAAAQQEIIQRIAELASLLDQFTLGTENTASWKNIQPHDSTAVLVTHQTTPDQGLISIPYTYNPWSKMLEPRSTPRRGLRALPGNAIPYG